MRHGHNISARKRTGICFCKFITLLQIFENGVYLIALNFYTLAPARIARADNHGGCVIMTSWGRTMWVIVVHGLQTLKIGHEHGMVQHKTMSLQIASHGRNIAFGSKD